MTIVACAMVTSALVVNQEVFSSSPDTGAGYLKRDAWEALTANGHRLGGAAAPVTVVEFIDYQCAACRVFALRTWPAIEAEFGQKVSLVIRNRPLPYHEHAASAARAADCAQAQGAFAEMHKALFVGQDSIGVKSYQAYAVHAGIPDIPAFNRCVEAEHPAPALSDEILNTLGARLIPTVAVDGILLRQPPSIAELSALVRSALKKRGHDVKKPVRKSTTTSTSEEIKTEAQLKVGMDRIKQAFEEGRFEDWKPMMDANVRFDGDRDLISLMAEARPNPPEDALGAGFGSVTVTSPQLIAGYGRLVSRVGIAEWRGVLNWSRPTLSKVEKDGELHPLSRTGDYVYDLHWLEAESGKSGIGLDGSVLFLIRRVNEQYRVIAHFADY